MVRLLLLAALLLGGGLAFKNEWIVVNWKKAGDDLGVPSVFDHPIFRSRKKSPPQVDSPSR